MSKTSRKAKRTNRENLNRGNVKPPRVLTMDIINDWLYDADMRHTMRYIPSESWTGEEWRYYWKTLATC